jgi:hypothetical protein
VEDKIKVAIYAVCRTLRKELLAQVPGIKGIPNRRKLFKQVDYDMPSDRALNSTPLDREMFRASIDEATIVLTEKFPDLEAGDWLFENRQFKLWVMALECSRLVGYGKIRIGVPEPTDVD